MASDKRRASRNKHNSTIEFFDDKGGLVGTGRLIDHSATGASFSASERLVVGDRVRARLRLFEKGIIDITGAVVWRRQAGNATIYGVRFDATSRYYPTGEKRGE